MHMDLFKRYFLSLVFLLGAGACGGAGGCGGCSFEELPAGGLPSDQTLDGGAQLRISSSGFDTLTQIVPAVLQDSFAGGVCIPEGGFLNVDYCYQNDGGCSPGCKTDFNIDSVNMSVPQDDQLRVAVQFDVHINVPVEAD